MARIEDIYKKRAHVRLKNKVRKHFFKFWCVFALGFQHLPRDLANVNEWKIMFDPYITNKNMYEIFAAGIFKEGF